jgi:hypothetical protein
MNFKRRNSAQSLSRDDGRASAFDVGNIVNTYRLQFELHQKLHGNAVLPKKVRRKSWLLLRSGAQNACCPPAVGDHVRTAET